jgi:hypothetical protein
VLLLVLLAACTGPAGPPRVSQSGLGTPPATATEPALVTALLARAKHLPVLAPGSPCPRGTPTSRSPVAQPADATGFGAVPLYPLSSYLSPDATLHLGDATPGPDGLYEVKGGPCGRFRAAGRSRGVTGGSFPGPMTGGWVAA